MAVIKVVDQTSKEVGELTLAPEIFEIEVRPEILHLVVRSQRAAMRSGTHATRNRALITGGGAKPWRQKGTGRARAGSSRSPLWRGGATIFGPQPRKYGFKINKKVRALALRMALSSRLAAGNLMVVDKLELPEVKTKLMSKVAADLGLKKALIVVDKLDNTLALSARNLPNVAVLPVEQLNVLDVLKYDQLVFAQDAVAAAQERLSK